MYKTNDMKNIIEKYMGLDFPVYGGQQRIVDAWFILKANGDVYRM